MTNIAHIGLDVHKGMIDVAIATSEESEVKYYGEIRNEEASILKLVNRLNTRSKNQIFYYEAGPCGYGLYRYLSKLNRKCLVIAPSLIPSKPGDRVKTNRRDAEKLARLGRAGELTAVCVPTSRQECLRDVVRAREDAVISCKKAKQNLLSFLLRHDQKYSGKCNWTQLFYCWVEKIKLTENESNIVLHDYLDAVIFCEKRITALEGELKQSFEHWELKPIAQALMALRGIDFISAMGIITEVGDLRRFGKAREFMSFVGLVPSEYSSGTEKRRGAITKTGNSHLRRILVESAWSAHHLPRKTGHWKSKAKHASVEVQEMAWKATKRLSNRYRRLMHRGKPKNKITVALARELAGFVWAIGNQAYKEMKIN
jgi:transposase